MASHPIRVQRSGHGFCSLHTPAPVSSAVTSTSPRFWSRARVRPKVGHSVMQRSVEHPSEPIRYYPLVPAPDIDVVDRTNLTVCVTLLDAPRRENYPCPRLRSFPRP